MSVFLARVAPTYSTRRLSPSSPASHRSRQVASFSSGTSCLGMTRTTASNSRPFAEWMVPHGNPCGGSSESPAQSAADGVASRPEVPEGDRLRPGKRTHDSTDLGRVRLASGSRVDSVDDSRSRVANPSAADAELVGQRLGALEFGLRCLSKVEERAFCQLDCAPPTDRVGVVGEREVCAREAQDRSTRGRRVGGGPSAFCGITSSVREHLGVLG